MCFLPFQEIVETTTVPEITTVAEIIEEGDSDGDDSVRLKKNSKQNSNNESKFKKLPKNL